MKVNLRLVEPNPFRDMKVDPIDPAHVAELAKSIKQDGFWGGVAARRNPKDRSKVQVLGGLHRIHAALRIGMTEADIAIGDHDDEAAGRIYAKENALQRHNTSTALAGSVAAALKLILFKRLRTPEIRSANYGAQNRDGVGQDAILKQLGDVPGLTDNKVSQQLANLKSSGDYDRIVSEITAEVEAEHAAELAALAAAEKARQEAEQREAEARARREQAEADKRKAREEREKREAEAKAARDAEAKRRAERAREEADKRAAEAEERRKRAAAEAERAKTVRVEAQKTEAKHAPAAHTRDSIAKERARPKHDVTFDFAGVSKIFTVPSHLEAFRRLAVKNANFLPVSGQAELAKRIVAAASNKDRAEQYRGDISIDFIEQEFFGLLSIAKATKRDMDAKDRKAREHELKILAWSERAKRLQVKVNVYALSLRKAVGDLAGLERSRPEGASVLWTQQFESAVYAIRAALEQIEEDLGYRPSKKSEPVKTSPKALN